jgi:phosphoribosylaminoimidazole carboxylase
MLAASASLLNINIVILDVGEAAPAKQIISPRSPALTHIDGSFADPEKIRELALKVDVITVEIEHVDVTVLKEIESTSGTRAVIHPSPSTIAVIQDKLEQKTYLRTNGCPVSEFVKVEPTIESVRATATQVGLPFMLKSRTLAYDGRGNFVVRTLDQAENALQALSNRPLYAEKWVPFIKEISVVVVRTADGDVVSYPAVETVHKDSICHIVFVPLRSRDPLVSSHAQRVAESAVRTFQGAGVFGVEMFLMEDGTYARHRVHAYLACSPIYHLITLRDNIHQRNRPSSSQLGALHHRSLSRLPIRESPSRHPRTAPRKHSPQSPLRCDAQYHRQFHLHGPYPCLYHHRTHHPRLHCPPVR